MANAKTKDADGSSIYFKASGAGSDVDPHIPEHLDTNSGALLTAAQAIQTAAELIDDMISGNEAQVDVVTSALPTGAATAANQSTGNTALSAIQTAVEAAQAALEIIDDWDESDRAAVNLIAAQAGISAGAGAVAANTPRTTLASDDPAVALLGTIDADTSSLAGTVGGSELQVDVVAALPAGTNAIGKLAANSGVDIGDVDITSTPIDGAIAGPADPSIDSYTQAAISASAGTANQSLIAAPGASKQIWVYGVQFTVGTGDGSVSFQDEDDTAISGVMPFAQNGGMAVSPSGNFAMPLWKVATNKALEVDTVTCDIKGSIQYAVVSV